MKYNKEIQQHIAHPYPTTPKTMLLIAGYCGGGDFDLGYLHLPVVLLNTQARSVVALVHQR